jgi:hypothetical protein
MELLRTLGAPELAIIVLMGLFSGPATFVKLMVFALFGLTMR